MYFRGIAADSKFQEKLKGYLLSEGYVFTGFYGMIIYDVSTRKIGFSLAGLYMYMYMYFSSSELSEQIHEFY